LREGIALTTKPLGGRRYANPTGFMSVARLCQLLKISHETYYRWVQQGIAPVPHHGIPIAEAQKLLDAKAAEAADVIATAASLRSSAAASTDDAGTEG
jgi:hypothetical protein